MYFYLKNSSNWTIHKLNIVEPRQIHELFQNCNFTWKIPQIRKLKTKLVICITHDLVYVKFCVRKSFVKSKQTTLICPHLQLWMTKVNVFRQMSRIKKTEPMKSSLQHTVLQLTALKYELPRKSHAWLNPTSFSFSRFSFSTALSKIVLCFSTSQITTLPSSPLGVAGPKTKDSCSLATLPLMIGIKFTLWTREIPGLKSWRPIWTFSITSQTKVWRAGQAQESAWALAKIVF